MILVNGEPWSPPGTLDSVLMGEWTGSLPPVYLRDVIIELTAGDTLQLPPGSQMHGCVIKTSGGPGVTIT